MFKIITAFSDSVLTSSKTLSAVMLLVRQEFLLSRVWESFHIPGCYGRVSVHFFFHVS